MKQLLFLLFMLLTATALQAQQGPFVTVRQQQFYLGGKPYYYIGTNYWYGSYLGLEGSKKRGVERLRKELDFLRSKGVTNLRVIAGAEGSGLINGVQRVGPSLQPEQGVFNEGVLDGLDLLLSEMGKRNMKAVVFLSNNWEWSGGFLQYLAWNGLIADSTMQRKLNWDEMRDYTSKFYSCAPCVDSYLKQVQLVVGRTNKVTGKKYSQDAAIMSWELANEPRPMRPAAKDAYKAWIAKTAAFIKSLDRNHLVTTGHEGSIALENDMPLFTAVHADKSIDYLTIHIWPKNWGWFKEETMAQDFDDVVSKTVDYIKKHEVVAQSLQKPLVVEEFGLPRDGHSFSEKAPTTFRDRYYSAIFNLWHQSRQKGSAIAGANFWAFGGAARPVPGQVFWKAGDELMGDPPMEEQGLNAVFDSDASTWKMIKGYTQQSAATKK